VVRFNRKPRSETIGILGQFRSESAVSFNRNSWSETIGNPGQLGPEYALTGVKPLKCPRRPEKPKRYNRPVPGDRVQMDKTKIARGVYQHTAVDDCSRFRVLGHILAARASAPSLSSNV